ncbi:MAG TPA: substrate-binding domain-containing protein, partial [Deinococcales bacterium]|nr:substrate-binding domain-containing protein [Deinococcales bacterium]
RLTARLLAEHGGRAFPFTALMAANDFVAIGAVHALRDAGLKVPDDVSVTGFDDVALARHFDPPLTTVAQDLEAQGARAVALLLDRLDGREVSLPPVTHLPLIERRSTGPARPLPGAQPPTPGRTAPRGVKKEEDV